MYSFWSTRSSFDPVKFAFHWTEYSVLKKNFFVKTGVIILPTAEDDCDPQAYTWVDLVPNFCKLAVQLPYL